MFTCIVLTQYLCHSKSNYRFGIASSRRFQWCPPNPCITTPHIIDPGCVHLSPLITPRKNIQLSNNKYTQNVCQHFYQVQVSLCIPHFNSTTPFGPTPHLAKILNTPPEDKIPFQNLSSLITPQNSFPLLPCVSQTVASQEALS
jgi:hypothetical protein